MPARLPVPVGERFGRLTVLESAPSRSNRTYWLCRCDCGNKKEIGMGKLRSGHTRSCGCLRQETSAARARERNEVGTKHGYAKEGSHHPLYWVWAGMRKRCRDPKSSRYDRYGGRGIEVCERWDLSFEAFLEDMGEKPEWATGGIDRIDNNGNYEPSNCRWSTRQQQMENRGY